MPKISKDKEEKNTIKKGKLAEFKSRAMWNRLASVWKDQSDLMGKVAISIMQAKNEIKRPGWHRGNDEEKERLKEACAAFEKAVLTNDIRTIAKADVAFHDIIFQSTGNLRLSQLVNNLAEQMYRYRYEYIKDEKRHDMLVNEHRKIYESIIQRDIPSAKEAIRIHIENQEKSIIRQIRLEKEK